MTLVLAEVTLVLAEVTLSAAESPFIHHKYNSIVGGKARGNVKGTDCDQSLHKELTRLRDYQVGLRTGELREDRRKRERLERI